MWGAWGESCFFFQAEDGIRDLTVTGVQTCALPIFGPASGDLVSVKDGVRPGEKVVIDGLDKLRDGAQVALIADSARGAASPATPAPPPGQRPHRHHTASSAAPSAQPPAAPVRMTS